MPKERLCGNSCIKYIYDNYNIIDNKVVNKNMEWITELALALLKYNFNIEVLCYDSNLFNDYKNIKNNDLEFLGFKYIKELEDKGLKILEKKLTESELVNEIKKSKFMILCVKSSIFNNNKNMEGGHYIVINKILGKEVEIINPVKENYEIKNMDLKEIINCCNTFGSWRILIKENSND